MENVEPDFGGPPKGSFVRLKTFASRACQTVQSLSWILAQTSGTRYPTETDIRGNFVCYGVNSRQNLAVKWSGERLQHFCSHCVTNDCRLLIFSTPVLARPRTFPCCMWRGQRPRTPSTSGSLDEGAGHQYEACGQRHHRICLYQIRSRGA